jgi:hypothetical protein
VKRAAYEPWVVLILLVAATVGLRLYFQYIPNFAPVAAVALFAGYLFRSRWMALLAPVSVMLISDAFIGGYQPALMLTVYGLLALPVCMRGWLRARFQPTGGAVSAATSVLGLLACALTASILFFVVTNFVTWLVTPWYPRSVVGLWQCYASAIPFFRYTMLGDMAFASLLFGGYAIVSSSSRSVASEACPTHS